MPKLRQNNPVLYIFIGMEDGRVLGRVRDIQRSRVDTTGIGYISATDSDSTEQILNAIQRAQTRFLSKTYAASGEIKVVYVLRAESPSSLRLAELKAGIEYYLQFLYPGGILTDIFLIVDDMADIMPQQDFSRSGVISMLGELTGDSSMAYMLSSINSHKLYEPDWADRICHIIALICVMKDFVSLQSESQVHKWYSERFFREDCSRFGGQFMTAGFLSVRKPADPIKRLMLAELLAYKEKNHSKHHDFEWSPKKIDEKNWSYLKDNIMGLAVDAAVDEDGLSVLTNKHALERLFGQRLERFFEVNLKAEHVRDGAEQVKSYLLRAAKDPQRGLYYVHSAAAPNGFLRRYLNELLAERQAELSNLNIQENSWLSERCAPPPKKKLSMLMRISLPEYIYDMAVKYLEPKFLRLEPTLEIARLNDALECVAEFYSGADERVRTINAFLREYRGKINIPAEDMFFQSGKLQSYYMRLLHSHIETDSQYGGLYSRLWGCFEKDAFKFYLAELQSYVDKVLWPLPIFHRGVVPELLELYGCSQAELYERLWQWILNNKHFNILLKTGGSALHSEINVFVDANSSLPLKTRTGNLSREKINLFYEENSERIDILYHGGAFSKGDLYYEALYEGKVK